MPTAPPPSYDTVANQPPAGGIPPPQPAPTGYIQAGDYNTAAAYGVPGPAGGYGAPMEEPKPEVKVTDGEEFIVASSFSDKAIRRGFIRKVYLILMLQLLVTFGFAALFSYVEPIKNWMVYGGGAWFYYVGYAVFFVTYFVLICIPSVRRKTPGNFICLAVFTLALSWMVGTISSFYETTSVLICAGITAAVCLAISIFAIQTKIDFTMCTGLLFALLMVLIFFGFSCMIVFLTIGYNYILDCVWGALAALVFSMFLVYDTQMVVGGRKHDLDPEEYVYGALQLYIDVVYLFLILLSLFGKSN